MLSLLARLGNPALVERMLDKLMSRQGHDKADNPAILEALVLFEPATAAEWLKRIMAANGVDALGSCGALLAGALAGGFRQDSGTAVRRRASARRPAPGRSRLRTEGSVGPAERS